MVWASSTRTSDLDVNTHSVDRSTTAISGSQSGLSRIETIHWPIEEYPKQADSWVWFPSVHELTSHYLREIGFLACFAQFCGATIFWISGLTALPGINNQMSQALLDGIYWTPQIAGGTGFIISGYRYIRPDDTERLLTVLRILFMLETQKKWYLPAPRILGWHIGLWNLIGALGFTVTEHLKTSSRTNLLMLSSSAVRWVLPTRTQAPSTKLHWQHFGEAGLSW